jgi:hypothetical protein
MKDNANAQDYKREMETLLNKIEKLQQLVVTRLYFLSANHPEAIIAQIGQGDTNVKAKSLLGSNRSKDYIKSLSFETQIKFIETIEKWLADKHPHVQLSIDYDAIEDICNCDKRDIGTALDENGIRYCMHCGYSVK